MGLAVESGVFASTIRNFEHGISDAKLETVRKCYWALEAAGVVFIDPDDNGSRCPAQCQEAGQHCRAATTARMSSRVADVSCHFTTGLDLPCIQSIPGKLEALLGGDHLGDMMGRSHRVGEQPLDRYGSDSEGQHRPVHSPL